MSNKNIKNKIDKAKELIGNIDEQEKELIKDAGKELVDVIKEAIEIKKATGKFNKTTLIAIGAGALSLFNVVNMAVQPDAIEYTDEVVKEIKIENDSINGLQNIKVDSLNTKLDAFGRIDEEGVLNIPG